MVAADLDGDGRLDLAVAAYNDNAISIFLQGSKGEFVRQGDLTAGRNPNSVVARQPKPGALPDLVATNCGESSVSVFANEGNGTFASQLPRTTGNGPLQCVVGSWSGEGHPDLACINLYDDNVALLPGLSDGSLGSPTTFGPLVFQPWEMTAADFRGNGLLDLAITFDLDSGEFGILPADGVGGFGAETTYYGEHTPYSVAAADCDGDGHVDLLVTHYNDHNIGFAKGNGDGTFATPVVFAVEDGPEEITIADLNGDGWPDAIVACLTAGTIDVLWNEGARGGWRANGVPGFSAPSSFRVGASPGRVISADFNGDGAMDIATTHDGAVQVFLNGCP